MIKTLCIAMLSSMLLSACALTGWPAVEKLPVIQELPDPLVTFDGSPVKTAEEWRNLRRPELISLFEHYMYGKAPSPPDNFQFSVDDIDNAAFNGKATRKLITLYFGPERTHPVSLLLVVPNHRRKPAPVFIGLNFVGNHTVMTDPNIPLPEGWVNNKWSGASDNRAHDEQRGLRSPSGAKPRWYIEKAVDRGYAVATMYAGQISPDRSDGDDAFTHGVHRVYFRPGQTRPGPHAWATIAAWAWGVQRGVDYLFQDPDIDNNAIITIGHSRLGKTALLAAAFDERIAIAIPSQAGCGGTSPSRSKTGESVEQVNRFSHWFNDTFKQFNQQVERLPFDQHALIALVAPRPLLLTNATGDEWSDPHGQFRMLTAAAPVYQLLGVVKPLAMSTYPDENILIDSTLGFFVRPGNHDMTEVEWNTWLDFADKHLQR